MVRGHPPPRPTKGTKPTPKECTGAAVQLHFCFISFLEQGFLECRRLCLTPHLHLRPPYTYASCVPFGRLGRASEGERVRGRRHAQCCGMWRLGCISKDSVVGVREGFCSYFNMPYGELHLTLVEGQDLKDGKIIMCCTQLCRYCYPWCSSNDVT